MNPKSGLLLNNYECLVDFMESVFVLFFFPSATQTETYIQLAIPYLPMWVAAICLVMNVLLPGTGLNKSHLARISTFQRSLQFVDHEQHMLWKRLNNIAC